MPHVEPKFKLIDDEYTEFKDCIEPDDAVSQSLKTYTTDIDASAEPELELADDEYTEFKDSIEADEAIPRSWKKYTTYIYAGIGKLSLILNNFRIMTAELDSIPPSRDGYYEKLYSHIGVLAYALYVCRFAEQYANDGEETFYYANARAAGLLLKCIIPLVFLPTLKRLNSHLQRAENDMDIVKYANSAASNRISLHKILGSAMIVLSVTHTIGHLAHNYPDIDIDKMTKQEWLTGAGMLAITNIPILGTYLALSRPSKGQAFYKRFLLPHQLGGITLLTLFAAHTKDYRLAPVACLSLGAFSLDRLREWVDSVDSRLHKVRKIHSSMAIVEITKPKGFDFRAGDYAMIAYPPYALSKGAGHPFTIAGNPSDENVQFLITAKGEWTQNLIGHLPIGTELRLSHPLASPLNITLSDVTSLMLISSGSGLALTLSFLSYIQASSHEIQNLAVYHSTREVAEITFIQAFLDEKGIAVEKCQFNLTSKVKALPDKDEIDTKHIMRGRADFSKDAFFKAFEGHVFFCGAPQIGRKLKAVCDDDPRKTLHMENFG